VRTTLDLDQPVLDGLKALQKRENRSLSQLASQLLAEGLARYGKKEISSPIFQWKSQPMEALIDLTDKETLYRVLDER
jgi:hypothetical protein